MVILIRRSIPALATLLLLVVIVIIMAVVWGEFKASDRPAGSSDGVFPLLFLGFPIVGWLLAVRRSHNPLGWIYLAFPLVVAIGIFTDEYAVGRAPLGTAAAVPILLIAGSTVTFFGYWLLIGPGILLFPDGRPPNRLFRWLFGGTAALAMIWGVLLAFGTESLCMAPFGEESSPCLQTIRNPLSVFRIQGLDAGVHSLRDLLFFFTLGVSLTSLWVRYRQSSGEVRQQIKWVSWVGLTGIVVVVAMFILQNVVGWIPGDWGDFFSFAMVSVGMPLAIGIAILKHRLYDIDRIISRSAAYTLVAAALAGVFWTGVAVTQQLLPFQNQFGAVVSTLAVAALFNPLRRRIQITVDRRFHRSHYDAGQILERFAQSVRVEVQLESLAAALLSAVEETLQPVDHFIWLAPFRNPEGTAESLLRNPVDR